MSPVPAPPTAQNMDRLVSVVAPLARITQPEVIGLGNIPDDRGVLLAGNHTLYGLIDVPFMIAELWKRRQITVRGLGEHTHYAIPVWRNLLELGGMVRGTRENVRELMRAGQNVLVFPGGSGEVFKDADKRYQLLWKERLGFARLAIEFGYPIVPFASVGIEDALHVVADRTTPGLAPVSHLMERLVGLPLPPIARGVGPTILPRPERLYFWFGEPIDTTRFAGRENEDEAPRLLRNEVRDAVESGIRVLRAERRHDPGRKLTTRLFGTAPHSALADSDPQAWFVTRAFDTWNDQGPQGAAAWLSARVELTDPTGWDGGATRRGRNTVIGHLGEVADRLGGGYAEVTEARTVSGDNVLISVLVRTAAGHKGRDLHTFHFIVTIEHGLITRMRAFLTEREAIAAAQTL